jgi:hypothetical protein
MTTEQNVRRGGVFAPATSFNPAFVEGDFLPLLRDFVEGVFLPRRG